MPCSPVNSTPGGERAGLHDRPVVVHGPGTARLPLTWRGRESAAAEAAARAAADSGSDYPMNPTASTGAGLSRHQLRCGGRSGARRAPVTGCTGGVQVGLSGRRQSGQSLLCSCSSCSRRSCNSTARSRNRPTRFATLKEQSLQRYMDLDKRLSGGVAAGSVARDRLGSGLCARWRRDFHVASRYSAHAISPEWRRPARRGRSLPGRLCPGAGASVRTAPIPAFKQFLQSYPGRVSTRPTPTTGSASCTWWWSRRDLEAARQSFALLLSQYPEQLTRRRTPSTSWARCSS